MLITGLHKEAKYRPLFRLDLVMPISMLEAVQAGQARRLGAMPGTLPERRSGILAAPSGQLHDYSRTTAAGLSRQDNLFKIASLRAVRAHQSEVNGIHAACKFAQLELRSFPVDVMET
ncbi:MAG: hypothetical protein JWP77_2434 [Polaromonas sp.]|nr:hypothetical protein [Polaromonas sp.]